MLQKIFDWTERYAEHKNAKRILSLVAFVESSFFPIPPFVMIVAMLTHAKKPSWVQLAVIGTVSSVAGGVAAYFIGKFFYGYIGAPLVAFYGIQAEVAHLGTVFKDHVFATIILASLSPLPYKVFTLSAGLFSVNLWIFIVASIIGRGIRFFAVAYIANRYGVRAKGVMIRQQKNITKIFLVTVVLGVVYYLLRIKGIL